MRMPPECRALIMAGGRSERMRATAGPQHKALVDVLGMSLLERSLQMLLDQSFRDIVVAISTAEPAISEYLETSGRALVESSGAHLAILLERTPRGTIGAAREAIHGAATLLVVNVDNLTSLPLQTFVRSHCDRRAALTIATHQEPFQIPFGELVFNEDRVQQYIEKPLKRIWISSGTYMLSPEACEWIFPDERTDVPQLVARLLKAGCRVAAFRHGAAWIDVNDADAVKRAERQLEAA
jgi:NDP-sugar pyrophosphorylase family protein